MKAMREIVLLIFCATLMLPGCAALLWAGAGAGAGVGTVSYIRGELKITYAAPLDQTWEASLGALKSLDINVEETKKDKAGGTIKGTRANGTSVKVTLEPAGPSTTSVAIRVGYFGDEEVSRTIHRKIAARLGPKSG